MREKAFALLVYDRGFLFGPLRLALKEMGISTWNCVGTREAAALVEQTHPQLVFVDENLEDGSWLEAVHIGQRAGWPVCVLVVGRSEDSQLRLSVLKNGGFDYLAPPFERSSLRMVIQSALERVRNLRETLARAAVA